MNTYLLCIAIGMAILCACAIVLTDDVHTLLQALIKSIKDQENEEDEE